MIVSWQENLPDEEMPPEWMWPLDHELVLWFDEVKRKRDEKYGRHDDDDDRDEVPMMSNALAAEKRGR
jgi:hypothetical protein